MADLGSSPRALFRASNVTVATRKRRDAFSDRRSCGQRPPPGYHQLVSIAMNASKADEYLTVAEIAGELKLNQQTIRNWIDQGSLRAVRAGRRVRVLRSDLDRMLAEGATAPAPTDQTPTDALAENRRRL